MCGIAGIVTDALGPERQARVHAQLRALLSAQAHRGPDGQGVWSDGDSSSGPHAHLGHRRLSIIAPGPLAAQPMCSRDGRYTLVLNGAIYNFVELASELSLDPLLRRSDTAVLLAAWSRWGPACLSRLNGMFAFAVWDATERTLHLCRDRFGEKPLCYVEPRRSPHGVRLAFASEAKALLAAGLATPTLDQTQLCEFLASYDIDHHPGRTLFSDIRSVEPGCHLILRADGQLQHERYYQLSPPNRTRDLEGAQGRQILDETTWLLQDAVRLRLRSDVPIAGSLSGGLDSSLLTALIVEDRRSAPPTAASPPLPYPVFSCQFPGAAADGDESPWAARVAAHLQLPEVVVVSPSAVELVTDLPELLYHQEAPFADTSIFAHYALVKAARAHGKKVLLSGQGGDEVFLGYPGQIHALAASRVLHRDFAAAFRWLQGRAAATGLSALRLPLAAGYHALPPALHQVVYSAWRRGAVPLSRAGAALLAGAPPRYARELPALCSGPEAAYSAFDRYQLDGLARYSLPHILRHDDRNSMALGIESRAPFLDHRLLDHVATLSEASLLADGQSKRLLRAVADGRLPDALCRRTDKRGFFSPQRAWLWHPLCEAQVRTRCHALPDPLAALIDQPALRNLLDAFYLGRRGELAGPVFLAWVTAEFIAQTLPRLATRSADLA